MNCNYSELNPARLVVLKKFGITLGIAFGLLDAFLFWRGKASAPVFLAITAFFLISAYLCPAVLNKVEIYWMKFAEKLSIVATFIILTLTFFLAITPLAILLFILRKDLLKLKIDRDIETYWEPVPPDAPGSRPFLPY